MIFTSIFNHVIIKWTIVPLLRIIKFLLILIKWRYILTNFSSLKYRYPSRIALVYNRRGMVAASELLAAFTGLNIKKSGNDIDNGVLIGWTEPRTDRMVCAW